MTRTPWLPAASRAAAATLIILLVPLIAMQFTPEMNWGLFDFVAAAALLFTAGMVYSILAGRVRTRTQRIGVGAAVLGVMLTVWAELAVGLFT